jgi:copper resistance protein D
MRMPRIFRTLARWINVIIASAFVASLAWAGHGEDGGGWHLAADAVHLIIAGLWPMGLVPFALVLFQLRTAPSPHRRESIAALTGRFSMMSLGGVMLLVLTGTINSLYMIRSVPELVRSTYGRVLILKLLLFLMMLCLGAVNRIWLKASLANPIHDGAADATAMKLRRNVLIEAAMAFIVLILTAILGLLAPGAS